MPDNKRPIQITFRKWQTIAQELSQETNPRRLSELSVELNRAIDEQALIAKPKHEHRPQKSN